MVEPTPTTARDREAFAELVVRHLDGDLDEVGRVALNVMLGADAAWRDMFASMVMQARLIESRLGPELAGLGPIALSEGRRRWRRRGVWAVRFAMAAVIVLSFGLLMWAILPSPVGVRGEGPTVAHLLEERGVVWGAGSGANPGDALRAGWVRLRSGRVVIEFISGARVTMQGPAELGLNSPMRGFLKRGKLVAQVPAGAHGFTMAVPGCAVVDLGTEFGLKVDMAGRSELVVFKGKVSLEPDGQPSQSLEAGAARAITPAGWVSETAVSAADFATLEPGLVPPVIETVTLTPTDDAMVDVRYADTPLGDKKELIANNDRGKQRWSYLRFDLSKVEGRVIGAKLILTANRGESYGMMAIYGVNSPVGTAWSERSMAWATAPARSGENLDRSKLFNSRELAFFQAPGMVKVPTQATVAGDEGGSITQYLERCRGGAATLILARPIESAPDVRGASWKSKEVGSPPELVLKIQKGD